MSWQGNELFVLGIEYRHGSMEGAMLDALDELLCMYDAHGRGWYLLGNFDSDESEGDYDPFELHGSWGCGWLPNPYMAPPVMAVNVRSAHDLLAAAFECWDSSYDAIGYAGNGDEPFERMVIYGKEHDLRAA